MIIIFGLIIGYYVAGCYAFCWLLKTIDEVDAGTIIFAMTIGWLFFPLTLLMVNLWKVFK